MAQTLIAREMFTQADPIAAGTPGAFTTVASGSIATHRVGARDDEMTAPGRSGVMKDDADFKASFTQTVDNSDSFAVGGWFRFRNFASVGAGFMRIMYVRGASGSETAIVVGFDETGLVKVYNDAEAFVDTATTLDLNTWYYIVLAVRHKADNTSDWVLYLATIGGALTAIQTKSNIALGQTSLDRLGLVNITTGGGRWRGHVSGFGLYSLGTYPTDATAFPTDLIDPPTAAQSWYAGSTGSSTNSGDEESPWPLDVTFLNNELQYGLFETSAGYASGDTLYIDTSAADLDLHEDSNAAVSLNIRVRGLNVKPIAGQSYWKVKSWHNTTNGSWTQHGTHTNLWYWTGTYGSESTDANCVWEDDVNPSRMARPDHASDDATLTAMNAKTSGEFWWWPLTDGSRVYIKPSGNGDPNSNGKTYSISANIGGTGDPPVLVSALDVNIEGLYCIKTALADTTTSSATDGDPIDGTPLSLTIGSGGTHRIADCYFDKWGKHAWKLVNSASDQVFIDEDIQLGTGSCYCPAGGQTGVAYFNGSAGATGNAVTSTGTLQPYNAMLPQSTGGQIILAHPSILVHNGGAGTQFDSLTISQARVCSGISEFTATTTLAITDSTFAKGVSGATAATVSRCKMTDGLMYNQVASKSMTVINSVASAKESYSAGNASIKCRGTMIYKAVTIDCSSATAGDAAAALFVRDSTLAFTFSGNLVNFAAKSIALIADAAAGEVTADYNDYSYAVGSRHLENYDSSDRTGTQAIALGIDANSLFSSSVVMEATNFRPEGTPLAVALASVSGLASTTDYYGRKRPASGTTHAGGVQAAQQGGMQGIIGSGLF